MDSRKIGHNGTTSVITAPKSSSQFTLIKDCLNKTEIKGKDMCYHETHGTGTKLGDPIEFSAFRTVLGKGRQVGEELVIGALKSNMGHLEGAAGIACLIKVILVIQHEVAPPNLHLKMTSGWFCPTMSVSIRRGRSLVSCTVV